jgi:hypothetical protein
MRVESTLRWTSSPSVTGVIALALSRSRYRVIDGLEVHRTSKLSCNAKLGILPNLERVVFEAASDLNYFPISGNVHSGINLLD